MTVHDLLAYGEYILRDVADLMREKWAEANDELPEL